MKDFVSVKDLADELNLDRSNMRKYILSKGIEPFKIRTIESGGQLTLALSATDADMIKELRYSEGFSTLNKIVKNKDGVFYVIRLIPELDPLRVKLGFAGNIQVRLSAHRTTSPTAVLIKTWPCKQIWEQAAIDCITRIGCEGISNEVFRCDDVARLIKLADSFFSLMNGDGENETTTS